MGKGREGPKGAPDDRRALFKTLETDGDDEGVALVDVAGGHAAEAMGFVGDGDGRGVAKLAVDKGKLGDIFGDGLTVEMDGDSAGVDQGRAVPFLQADGDGGDRGFGEAGRFVGGLGCDDADVNAAEKAKNAGQQYQRDGKLGVGHIGHGRFLSIGGSG